MPAANRLGLAFLLLIAAFVVLIAIASASLWAAGQAMLALVVAVVGVGAGAAGAATYWIAQGEGPEGEPCAASVAGPAIATPVRKPIRVQAMPVADLPPEYVAAVMRGTRARTHALRTQAQAQAQGRAH
jgi:hypothetical protein